MATILLVEDERDLALLVRANIEAEGHTVTEVDRFFSSTWRFFETKDRGFAHPTPIQGDWT